MARESTQFNPEARMADAVRKREEINPLERALMEVEGRWNDYRNWSGDNERLGNGEAAIQWAERAEDIGLAREILLAIMEEPKRAKQAREWVKARRAKIREGRGKL